MPIKSHEELSEIASRILRSCGVRPMKLPAVSHGTFAGSNLVGLDSHGIIRLPDYVAWLQEGKIAGENRMEVVKEKGATCLIDAHMSFGPSCGIAICGHCRSESADLRDRIRFGEECFSHRTIGRICGGYCAAGINRFSLL